MRVLARLSSWWFSPAPARRLALLRIAVGAWTLVYLWPRWEMYTQIARTRASLYEPVGLARLLAEPLPPVVFDGALAALIAFAGLFLVGWKHRWTGPAFALLLLAVLSYRNSWSMIYHNDNGLVFHALVLGLSRSADAYSLDARDRSRDRSWVYGWPIRTICMATAMTYFVAGVAKLASPAGLSWASGRSMRDQIATDAVRKVMFGGEAADMFHRVYDLELLFVAIGVLTFVLELGAPLFVLGRRSAWAWAMSTWAMHWGILLLMDIRFRYQLTGLMFLAFFPIERAFTWTDRLHRAPTAPPVEAR